MDRKMQPRHLEEAEGHIAQGKRHIAEQEARIVEHDRDGHDTTEARRPLDNFYAAQART